MFTKRVHVFKAGPQTSAQGIERNFSPEDLQQVVESYDPSTHEAPLVIGHSGDNDSTPSFGWIKKFVRKGEDLYADVNFTDVAKDLVKDGHYRKVSISFYSPDSPINPHKGQWSARHLALLGAAPPAVKGLESLSFTEGEGVFNYATTLSPEDIFDKDLGPTLVLERSPLELLRERLAEVRGDIETSIEELKQSEEEQTETNVDKESQPTNQADQQAAPENPNQQFSEMKMKKKMGREGAEVSESAQNLANLETMAPEGEEEEFEEGVTRMKAKGAHGQEVQVVQEVFEEPRTNKKTKAKKSLHSEDHEEEMEDEEFGELPPALKANAEKMKAKAAAKHSMEHEEEEEDYGELPPALKANAAKMKAKHAAKHSMDHEEDMDMEEMEDEDYSEPSHKVTSPGNKVSFKKHSEKGLADPAGRGTTARSRDDSYADRQAVGKGPEEDREGVTSDEEQDKDRVKTAKNAEQEQDRFKLAKSSEEEAEGESRWADQAGGKKRAMNADQFDDGEEGLDERNKPGVSDGNDPHGRDGGPTRVSSLSEEEPDYEDIAVPLESTRGNKVSRVLHTSSGQKRAALKGGAIADHSEESDGVTRTAKKAGVSDGTDPYGRDGGPTEFPTRSEEEPDDLEMAVDLEDATESDKVRIIRQKSGDKPSLDHSEDEVRDPMTKTGKGSTYGQKANEMEEDDEDEDEEFNEFLDQLLSEYEEDDEEDFAESDTEDFCGMGSMGQAKAIGFPQQMYEELMNLKAENDRLKREYEESKVRSRKEKIAQFVDSLYTEGKLTDGIMPQREFCQYCEGLELGTLEFSEGETPTSKLFELLSRLPNMVYFGEVVADGLYQTAEEEEEDLDPHNRALKMVANGEASDYVEAIKRCISWGN